jgi:hypothetical protein
MLLSDAGLDLERFTLWLCQGYEAVAGVAVDRDLLAACVRLRREMYHRFCARAKAEGDLPPDMAAFIEWTLTAFEEKRL